MWMKISSKAMINLDHVVKISVNNQKLMAKFVNDKDITIAITDSEEESITLLNALKEKLK